MNLKENLIDDCKKYLGKPPYDTWTNIVVGDLYFYMGMCNKYGEQSVADAIQEVQRNDQENNSL